MFRVATGLVVAFSSLLIGAVSATESFGAEPSSGEFTGRPLLLRPEEAAEQLRCGRPVIYELIRSGELRSVLIGRSRRIPATALREFVDQLIAESDRATTAS